MSSTAPVATIGPDATVAEAAAEMQRRSASALVVMDDDRLVGLLTERDLVRWRGVALNGWAGVQGHTGTTSGIEAAELRAEMQRLQATLSWRVTAPLRQVRRLQTGLARRR